ncbi:MAG TPA: ribonuclease HII [Candidatus Saccharimonadales bacterium]|nr:ribonuclease HII [Candidatus Saccharimonadales bacterium]
MIVGVDEVGRGCLAGPVAAGAVVLDRKIRGLKDSKLLSRAQRESLDLKIRAKALHFGVGWASVEEINRLGMTEAVRLAMHRAVDEVLKTCQTIEQLIVDGNYNYFKSYSLSAISQAIIKADQSIPAVSAASIIAKVARDLYMITLAKTYPNFGFESHVGYATQAHRQALRTYGVTDVHRVNFRQVKEILLGDNS